MNREDERDQLILAIAESGGMRGEKLERFRQRIQSKTLRQQARETVIEEVQQKAGCDAYHNMDLLSFVSMLLSLVFSLLTGVWCSIAAFHHPSTPEDQNLHEQDMHSCAGILWPTLILQLPTAILLYQVGVYDGRTHAKLRELEAERERERGEPEGKPEGKPEASGGAP